MPVKVVLLHEQYSQLALRKVRGTAIAHFLYYVKIKFQALTSVVFFKKNLSDEAGIWGRQEHAALFYSHTHVLCVCVCVVFCIHIYIYVYIYSQNMCYAYAPDLGWG